MEQSRLAAAKKRSEAEMWVHNHAIPNIRNFIARKDYRAAFELAERAEQAVPEDPILVELRPEFSAIWSVSSVPAGAEVNGKPYSDPPADWRPLGRTPLERVRLPRGLVHWKLTREGYAPVEGFRESKDGRIEFTLDRRDVLPEGMVRVAGNQYRATYYGTEDTSTVELEDYFIDRYEVTNRRFKEFVDAGGYETREYWKQPFVKASGEDWKPSYIKATGEESTMLAWEAAMREFRDATGKPGPATWRDGTFPPGEDEFPVGGITWYEAAAYAEFVGKSLPTITHWVRASGLAQAGLIMPLSNFGRVGPVRVGTALGLGPFGTSDMAGNLKEWCWNKDAGDRRCVAGGSWDEYEYMFSIIDYASAWDRSFHNGFRCVKYVSEKNIPPALLKSIQPEIGRDYDKETPASDEVFQVYKSFYSYEKSPLNARVDAREESADSVHETISLDTAYDQDRVIAHLYLPRTNGPPYQGVVFFPPITGYFEKSFPKANPPPEVAFLVKAGRAVLWPVYHGMYERSSDRPFRGERAQIVAEVKDFGRCVDYLDVRKEIDPEKLAYFGVSYGALHGVIQLAVEDRLKVGVLVVGGFPTGRAISPEIDPIHFAPRVRRPVLMLNGRNDPFFPVRSSQRPLYQRLGSPAKDKMHITYDVPGHSVPPAEAEKEMLAWLDRYLGPVRRQL
jgi:formylglycine-generating enzyme required for sulfatase activity/dienelactone hydrolase